MVDLADRVASKPTLAFRWTETACGDCACDGGRSEDSACRRADRALDSKSRFTGDGAVSGTLHSREAIIMITHSARLRLMQIEL